MMWGKAVLCLFATLLIYSIAVQGQCTDLRGLAISHGMHYVPGPDTCTLCVCDNGLPKVCKAVLCSPPQDCRSFRVGTTCCEFICLDDVVKPAEGTEANLRMAAGGAAVVVLVTIALIVYRVRRQKRRRPPHTDDQRSLTSIGYISGSMAYMGGTCETGLAAWKPPSQYMPRGEAPPPYDEVVAQCRQDNIRVNETSFHRSYPATMEALARPEDTMPCLGHGYVNIPRPMPQMSANPGGCYTAPLLQPVMAPEARDPAPQHPLAPTVIGFPSAIRLTGSLGAISNRGLLSVLQREPDPERPHNVPGFYTSGPVHTSLHRTIPRISGGEGFGRTERGLQAEVRRSFHRPEPRTMPRAALASAPDVAQYTCNIRAREGRSRAHSEEQNVGSERPLHATPPAPLPAPLPAHAPLPAPPPHAPPHGPPHAPPHNPPHGPPHAPPHGPPHGPQNAPQPAPPPHAPPPAPPHAPPHAPPESTPAPPPPTTLPLTVDKPSCVCSYERASAPGAEDADDYLSECENCKAASNSRWVVEEGWEEGADDGTQTLQRRAPLPSPAPPATATLPQPVTKQSRTIVGPPSNWENWFNTIPDSDTESEEE